MAVVTGFAPPPSLPSLREVAEAWGSFIDPRDFLRDEPGFFSGFGGGILMDRPGDRERGGDPPRFDTEQELAMIRGVGRFFGRSSNIGIGCLARLGSYTFGAGFAFEAQAASGVGEVSDELLAAVQHVIDAFVSRNKFSGNADREIDRRARADGECVLALDLVDGWQADMRFVEPAQLTEPADSRRIEDYLTETGRCDCYEAPLSWTFGVQTREGRHDVPIGYHFIWSPSGRNWDWYDESRVVHIKRNVDRNVKRGVSDFHPIHDFIAKSERLLPNMVHGASIQAAIPFVKQFLAEATNGKIEDLRTASATPRNIATPEGRREIYQQHFAPGTIPLAKGWDFKDGPGGDNRIAGFVAALQACFRYVGTRWDMPEAMVSGDASNANLASSLVAEAPFVKAREADQQVYANEFRSLLWKAIRLAHSAGRFHSFGLTWSELQTAVFIKVDVPKVATRDRLQDAQVNEIEKRAGVLSARTWAAESGRDYDAELDAGAKPEGADLSQLREVVAGQPVAPVPTGETSLNGAQIESAVTVLAGVRSGSVALLAAEELLSAIGISRDRAKAMIAATQNLPAHAAEPTKTESLESESLLRRSLASFRSYP